MHSIYKHQLDNGLTIIVYPTSYSSKVCTQLWYHVGSADEVGGQRGTAHLLEHMAFKGTDRLSEVDLTAIVHKLSGYTNAFTSYDYTGYIFSLPVPQWEVSLDILADCMINCRFDQEHLNSEMRTVIQELRLYEDEFESAAVERLLTQIFAAHPYQHPIIGYRSDVRNATPDSLRGFYRKWYRPNNSALIVVGPVDQAAVVQAAERFFGSLQPGTVRRAVWSGWRPPVGRFACTLYREVSQATAIICWVLPGLREMPDAVAQALAYLLGKGKQALLYQVLVVQYELAAVVDADIQAMSDYTVLSVTIVADDSTQLKGAVDCALEKVQTYRPDIAALERAIRSITLAWYTQMEVAEEIAYHIGQQLFASGTIDLTAPQDQVELMDLVIAHYKNLRATRANIAWVLPIAERDKGLLIQIQDATSKDDEQFLATRARQTGIEPVSYANQLRMTEPLITSEPAMYSHVIPNGLRCCYVTREDFKKIEYVLWLPANYLYDPPGRSGLAAVTEQLLDQGTISYPGQAFTAALERYGMHLSVLSGQIRLIALPEQAELALELLGSMLSDALLEQDALERVLGEQLALIVQEEDDPYAYVDQLARELLFAGHPYAQAQLGTISGIGAVEQKHVREYYSSFISPQGALLAIIAGDDVQKDHVLGCINRLLGTWSGPPIPTLPALSSDAIFTKKMHLERQRDQTALALVARSVSVFDENYFAVQLLDYILLGGEAGSMYSRLFQLREQTGFFYAIGGSLLTAASFQPGYMIIKTLVNPEMVQRVTGMLYVTLNGMKTISKEDLKQAQQALLVQLSDQFETAYGIARYYLRAQRYFQAGQWNRWCAHRIQSVTREQLHAVARDLLAPDRFTQITIGRGVY